MSGHFEANDLDDGKALHPKNRYVTLEEVDARYDEEEIESTVLVPEEFRHKHVEPYKVYMLDEIAPDCTQVSEGEMGKLVVVNNTMVEKLTLDGEGFLLVQENHIYGVIEE